MNYLFCFFLSFILTLNSLYSQCNQETITYDNGNYIGCINYEGEKHGKGVLTSNLETQIQIKEGIFENDNFIKGTLTVKFFSGSTNTILYSNYPSDVIESELYEWSNRDKLRTLYSGGKKIKEISTYGAGKSEGLVIEKLFNLDVSTSLNKQKNS